MPFELDAYEVLDERFYAVRGDVAPTQLFGECRWAEGPVYVPAGRYVLFSDIPNDRLLKWDETSASTSVFDSHAAYPNGHTLDRQGRVIACQHGARRVVRTEHDGATTVIADSYLGAKLNSPNDVIVASDDAVWFTDSSYGIDSDYEGDQAEQELDGCYVFRVDPSTGECTLVIADAQRPTGLAFSSDQTKFYLVDSRANHIRSFTVHDDKHLSGGDVLVDNDAFSFDGVRIDREDRLWVASSDGIHCYSPDGSILGKLKFPESPANLEFGGPKRNRLYVCATTSLYSIGLAINGVARPSRTT